MGNQGQDIKSIVNQTDQVETKLDSIKTSTDSVKTSTDSVKTSTDLVKTAVDSVKTSTDSVKTATDAVKTAVDAVKTSTDAVTTAIGNIPAPLQGADGETVTIEWEHEMVHLGKAFSASDLSGLVASATPKYWLIKAPSTASAKEAHAKFEVNADKSGVLTFFNTPTTTADGTGLTAWNANRNSSTAAVTALFKDPTVTGVGTEMAVRLIGSTGTAANRIGGSARTSFEIILKKDTVYLVRFVPDNNDTRANLVMEWYEE